MLFERLPTEDGGLKVGDLKRMVYERLMLPATLQLSLSCYGRVLHDDAPLLQSGLANGCKLDLSTTLRRNPHTSLHRLRVRSTALRTRQLPADGDTTVADLKQAYIGAECEHARPGHLPQISPQTSSSLSTQRCSRV